MYGFALGLPVLGSFIMAPAVDPVLWKSSSSPSVQKISPAFSSMANPLGTFSKSERS